MPGTGSRRRWPPKEVNWLHFLHCSHPGSLAPQGWMDGKALASTLETSAGREPYFFLQMPFWICLVSACTDFPYSFWMARHCPQPGNQGSTSRDPLRIFQAYDSELVIWWKQRWNIWVCLPASAAAAVIFLEGRTEETKECAVIS